MTNFFKSTKPVVFIGAAGEMCRIAVDRFAKASDAPLILTDINTSVLETVASKLSVPANRVTTKKLDLFDRPALLEQIKGAGLVVLGAGPYMRTSEPVLSACLEAKVPYLDFDDDVESTQAALGLHERAKKEGVPCYIGCGASPGMSNVMVMDVTRGLDTVESIDIGWSVGDGKGKSGKAVLEHLMHIAAGPCLTWVNSKPVINESWVETMYAPMVAGKGEMLLHETAHPEPVTFPRLFPNASRIRCAGSLEPAPLNGLARGIGCAVRRNSLSMSEAVDFLFNLINTDPSVNGMSTAFGEMTAQLRGGDITIKELFQLIAHANRQLTPWRYALWGMIETIWSGECTAGEVLTFLVNAARGHIEETGGGMLVRAVGTRNGVPVCITKRTPKPGENAYLNKSMGTVTGTSCAAFMVMAMEDGLGRNGVYCPEDWADPDRFYKALESVGTPREEIIERA
ncbi:Saccharopine dehydrogenase [Aspergillus sclerotialis]|uniref:Saccharopine dehydrogenase n=1 Tax=Aspergillus sclerotialis TaxID=2070753 RepID=A0A3A2ZWQ4_9EURO|nr:Saccharopine dehydrogenase [Aspergillus sclerotialis]